jgi:pyrroloquinoline quinone (PQQ) biosynthesis protein C
VADARELIAETRAQLKATEDNLLAHPYLSAVEEGRISEEKLRLFAGEQYHIINSDLRSAALLVSRQEHGPNREFFLGTVQGEATAGDALLAFARALGMNGEGLHSYEPMPGCQAYPAYVAWLAAYGSAADFAAAFLVNLPAWGGSCARMSAVLKGKYGLSSEAVAFFDLFAAPAPEFETDSLRVIQYGLDRGADVRAVARAARLIQAYELMYWDTLYEAST